MVCSFVNFATFGIFAILVNAHFGVAENILANFAIFSACLGASFLNSPLAIPRL